MTQEKPKAILFDVFGTVVDWRKSIILELELFFKQKSLEVDCANIADLWRGEYVPSMDSVRKGEIEWKNLDELHFNSITKIFIELGIKGITKKEIKELIFAWHRLSPWPDSVEGLLALKENYIIGTLSNGNVSLLTNMAKYSGLSWDIIFSAEHFKHYKPDQEVYIGASKMLDIDPCQIMLVAAHNSDLFAAKNCGYLTTFLARTNEYGFKQKTDLYPLDFVDYSVNCIMDVSKIF